MSGRAAIAGLALAVATSLSTSPAVAAAPGSRPSRAIEAPAGALGLPRQTWAACGVADPSTKLVRTFTRAAGAGLAAGTAALKCGSSAWGFRHIKAQHGADWAHYAGLVGSDWRSFADWAIQDVLRTPASVTYVATNDTYVYRAQLQFRDRYDRIVATRYVRVVVARITKNVITAYIRTS